MKHLSKSLLPALLLGSLLCALAPAATALEHGKRGVRTSVRSSEYRSSQHRSSQQGSSHHEGSRYGTSGRRSTRSHYASSRVWIPGRYETVSRRVWVPGSSRRVWVEPTFELRIGSHGSRFRVQLSSGCWRVVQGHGHYETRFVRVYRPGHWVARGRHH